MMYPEKYRDQLFYKLHVAKTMFGSWGVYHSIYSRDLPIATGSTPQEAWARTLAYLKDYKVRDDFFIYLTIGAEDGMSQ